MEIISKILKENQHEKSAGFFI
jgi:hypothetical protein